MNRLRLVVLALVTFALPWLLAAGALAGLPEGLRLTLAFAALVLLPGHALLAATGALPPGGAWLSSSWALGFGVAWLGLLILLTRMLHLPFTVLATGAAIPSALLWLASLPARGRGMGQAAPAERELHPAALAAVLAAALLAGLHCARLGTPVAYYSDSPDHIGTIRRMMAGGDAFPTDAFFRDAGTMGADPRKGLWHPCVALIATLAHVDPLVAWRGLAALIAPLFVLTAASFAFMIGGSVTAAVGAWALLLTYGGSMGAQYLREAVFATKLADQLALATITAVLFDLERRTRMSRMAAVGLALGTVAAHVFPALQFAVVFSAFGVGLLVRDRGVAPALRRFAATVAILGAACLPYLLWRARLSYAPNNIIHLEPQGLLLLWPGAKVVSIGVLWDWLGTAWMLFPLSWWAYAKHAQRPVVLMLLTTSVAVALLLFCPPLVAVLSPRLGYLLMRFVWLLPLSGAVAFSAERILALARQGGAARLRAALAGVVVLALLRTPLQDAAHVLLHPQEVERQDAAVSVERWIAALRWMDRHLPAGSVVLSDPATSYSIPMMTRHYVATLVDQHSSPNDSLALTRILQARDALSPYSSWARTREIVAARGVTAIALNDRFTEVPRLDYWAPDPAWYRAARARFDAESMAFHRVYDADGFVVYTIERPALDALALRGAPGLVRPYVRQYVPQRDGVAVRVAADSPALQGFALSAPVAHPGDTLSARLDWRVLTRLPAGSYDVAMRFDRPVPGARGCPAWCAKPLRKLIEKRRGERYRFRVDHIPTDGDYGVDLWSPFEVVRDSMSVVVPGDVAAGDYQVQVRMLRQPHYPNYHLGDYFFDQDYYSGVPVGTLTITRAAARH